MRTVLIGAAVAALSVCISWPARSQSWPDQQTQAQPSRCQLPYVNRPSSEQIRREIAEEVYRIGMAGGDYPNMKEIQNFINLKLSLMPKYSVDLTNCGYWVEEPGRPPVFLPGQWIGEKMLQNFQTSSFPACNAAHPINGPRPDIDDYGMAAWITNKPCRRHNGEIVK